MLRVNNLAISRTIAESCAPKVLLITAYRWCTTTRLAFALSEAGLTVEALCPFGHSLTRVKFVSKVYSYRALHSFSSLRNAIASSKPDLIIPSDDTTAAQIHELYKLTNAKDSDGNKLRSLIIHSLGYPTNYPIFYSRARIASLAQAAGILRPTTANIRNDDELFSQLDNIGLPAVLKADGTFGGMGVEIIHTRAEAKYAFTKLTAY